MMFWIVAALGVICTAALLLRYFYTQQFVQGLDQGCENVSFYKAHLRDLEVELTKGNITQDAFEESKTQLARQLLAAQKQKNAKHSQQSAELKTPLVAGVIVLLLAPSLVLYWYLGAPGYPDIPHAQRIESANFARENRPSQAQAEAAAPPAPESKLPQDMRETIERLRRVVASRPQDLEGWQLLATQDIRLQNYKEAAKSQAQIIVIKGDKATIADHTRHLTLMVSAANGFISPESEDVIGFILEHSAQHIPAKYYLGELYNQTDRPDIAFKIWSEILASPHQSQYALHSQFSQDKIADAAFRAGIKYSPPNDTISADADVQARQNVVSSLANRLSREGGPVEDWAKLITSYGSLEEYSKAQMIYAEAKQVFSKTPKAIERLKNAASTAGIAP